MRDAGDSIGARVTVCAEGVPPGLGEPVFDRLDADIAGAMMGINAVKARGDRRRLQGRRRSAAASTATSSRRRVQEQSRRRHARRHLLGPGHRREHRAQAHLQHHGAGRDHRRARQSGRDRDHRPPRSVRRLSRHADRGGDDGDRADGSLPAVSRAVRGCGRQHAGDHAAAVHEQARRRRRALPWSARRASSARR